jgi:hypothetical protein
LRAWVNELSVFVLDPPWADPPPLTCDVADKAHLPKFFSDFWDAEILKSAFSFFDVAQDIDLRVYAMRVNARSLRPRPIGTKSALADLVRSAAAT